ncbi:MAG: anti-sigma factor [Planctomycetota bacterium]|nr:anti-sigma factor [Planctomycetota bacterium]
MSKADTTHFENRRLQELLAGQVLGDLDELERAELDSLRHQYPESEVSYRELETTLARVQLGFERDPDPMPFGLRERIHRNATASLSSSGLAVEPAGTKHVTTSSSFPVREAFAWTACAVALLLAVSLWRPQISSVSTVSLSDQRLAMINGAAKLVRVDWVPGTTPFEDAVTGDVVWDNDTQQGYMRFVNMPVNDPLLEQYQLWIIDPKRDTEPIDGGVFDITESGEVIVAIDAKLKVLEPAAFAITIEQPGGVVVSTQERLPLLAKLQ